MLFTHGNLNSMLFSPSWENTVADADDAGAMVIAVDRPGYGESSIHPGRTYHSWSEDVRELLDGLGLDKVSLVGFSSGGPHAMAAAAFLGERISSLHSCPRTAPTRQWQCRRDKTKHGWRGCMGAKKCPLIWR